MYCTCRISNITALKQTQCQNQGLPVGLKPFDNGGRVTDHWEAKASISWPLCTAKHLKLSTPCIKLVSHIHDKLVANRNLHIYHKIDLLQRPDSCFTGRTKLYNLKAYALHVMNSFCYGRMVTWDITCLAIDILVESTFPPVVVFSFHWIKKIG